MVKFSLKSVALKWYFFSCIGSVGLFCECFNLFMKQLGFNPGQIGLTTLFGIQHLFIPLCLFFGEKFRARKIVAVFGTLAASVCCMLPLLSLVVPALQPICNSKLYVKQQSFLSHGLVRNFTSNKSVEAIKQPIFTDVSNSSVHATANNPYPAHSKNSNTRTRIADSKTHHSKPYLISTHTPSIPQVAWGHNGQMFSKYSKDKKRQPVSNIHHFLRFNNTLSIQRMRRSSVPTNYSGNPAKPSTKTHNSLPLLGALFALLTVSRSLTQLFERVDLSLANLVTITHIQGEKASYGLYRMWSHIGCTLSISCVAVLAWYIRINICGVEKYGYFIAFIWGGIMFLLSMLSLPWFKFEYNEKKTFTWSGVKSDIFNAHYIFMFVVLFYAGMCLAFQSYWEFWYLDELSASPLLIAGAVLVRRPVLATSMFMSCHCIRMIGDLKTICVALFLFACSYLALSFTRIAWLVIVIDTCQATAYGLGYCALTVLFSKAASKENASVIFGE